MENQKDASQGKMNMPEGKETPKAETKPKKTDKPAVLSPMQNFQQTLAKFQKPLLNLLDEYKISPEKYMTVVYNAVRKTPKLLNADINSLMAAILTSAEFGLEPNTPAQYSYIIPYGKEAQFQIGYHGIVALLYRNSRVLKVSSELVFMNDSFDYFMDDEMNMRVNFRPYLDGDRGDRRGVFCVIHLRDAKPVFQFMNTQQIGDIKKLSKSPQTYEKNRDPEGWMWKKAVIKQAAKLVPKDYEKISRALQMDSALEGGARLTLDQDGNVVVNKAEKEQQTDNAEKLNSLFGNGETVETPYEEVTE
jgi:recombination protein RecT